MCQVHSNCMQLLQCTPVSDMWKSYFYADPVQSEKFQLGRRSIWDSLHGILVVRTVGWHRVELVPVHGKVWHHQVLWISTPCLSMQGCGQSVVFIKCLGPRAVRSRYIKSPGPNDIRCQQVFSILFHPFPLRPPIGLVANLPNPSLAFSSVTEIISLLPLAEQFGWEFATLRLHIGDLWSFHLFDSPPEFMGPSRMRNLVGVVALLHVRMDVAAISSGDPQCHHSNNCHGPFLFKGVAPSLATTIFMAPKSNNKRTTSRCPFQAAKCRGVQPVSLLLFSLSAPTFSKCCTTSSQGEKEKGQIKKHPKILKDVSTHIQAFPTRTTWKLM